jgi:hypothetical protein
VCRTGAGTATIDNLTGTGSFPTATSTPSPTGDSGSTSTSGANARPGFGHPGSSQLYALLLVAARQLVFG